jgi:hypothetical protein
LAAWDLSGDGHPDLAVGQVSPGAVTVLLNDGSGKLPRTATYRVAGEIGGVAIADLNRDGRPDLVATAFEAIAVLLAKGGGKFGKAVYYSTKSITQESDPYAVVVAASTVMASWTLRRSCFRATPGCSTVKAMAPLGRLFPSTSVETLAAGQGLLLATSIRITPRT